MSITLTGVKSDVVIQASKLAKAIKDETGIVLKLSDDDYGQKLDNIMQVINTPSTIKAYERLTGKQHAQLQGLDDDKSKAFSNKNSSTMEIIRSNLHHIGLSKIFNLKSEQS